VKNLIQHILERELDKLNIMSRLNIEPMAAADIKSLDTLIKAYRSFVAPEATPPTPDPKSPAIQSTEDLLSDLNAK